MSALGEEKARQATAQLQDGELWLFYTQEGSDPSVPLVFDTNSVGKAAFMLHSSGPKALVSRIDAGHFEQHSAFLETRTYSASFETALIAWLRDLAPHTVLLNFSEDDIRCDGLTHGQYLTAERLLAEALPQARLQSSETQLSRVRAVKTPEELRRLQQAIDCTITFYDRLLPTLHIGQTERQIQARMNDLAAELGTTPYLGGHGGPLVCLNRIGLAHRGPTDQALCAGDLLILDTGLGVDGYFSDLARTCYVRAPGEDRAPSEVQAVFQAIYGAITAAFGTLRPGIQGREVDAAARAALRQGGQPELSHATGHQIGRHVHDGGTLLGPDWERYGAAPQGTVKAGEVYTLEPTVVQSPLPSMIVEENVVVTDDGARWLSRRQEQLWLI